MIGESFIPPDTDAINPDLEIMAMPNTELVKTEIEAINAANATPFVIKPIRLLGSPARLPMEYSARKNNAQAE